MGYIPSQSQLAEATLNAIRDLGGKANISEIESEVISKLQIDPESCRVVRSGTRTELSYRLSWARTKLKSEGKISRASNRTWTLI